MVRIESPIFSPAIAYTPLVIGRITPLAFGATNVVEGAKQPIATYGIDCFRSKAGGRIWLA